uniref:Teratocyte attacin I n=1 Tax=Cotesia flavipes TaxID=89805 RepID=A0A8K1YTR5_COTFL|nr:teratocyte attacin I [Cotesia flavipes]
MLKMLSFAIALVLLCAGVHSQNVASYTFNSDGTTNMDGKFGLAGNDVNAISAIVSKSSTGANSQGLAWDHV